MAKTGKQKLREKRAAVAAAKKSTKQRTTTPDTTSDSDKSRGKTPRPKSKTSTVVTPALGSHADMLARSRIVPTTGVGGVEKEDEHPGEVAFVVTSKGAAAVLDSPENVGSDDGEVASSEASADAMWYNAKDKKDAKKGKKHELKKFVRSSLFPRWKFFTKKKQLVWEDGPDTICGLVCDGMHVKPAFQERWWHNNQDIMMRELNRKRSDVVGSMKRVFMGK
jgi:hypothetical protein